MSDVGTLIERKSKSLNQNERLEYIALKALSGGDSTEIIKEFGIDIKKINYEAERLLGKQISKVAEPQQKKVHQPMVTENPFASDLGSMSAESAADFFANLGSNK